MNRRLFLNDKVRKDAVAPLIERIFEINDYDDLQEEDERKPIELFINSYGGSMYNGLALIDTILTSKTPIHTQTFGTCNSMAFVIFLCGKYRTCGKHSTFMYHGISFDVFGSDVFDHHGKMQDVETMLKEGVKLQKFYDEIVLNNTTLKKRKLDQVKREKRDWFLSAEEALNFDIVHKILT